LSTVLNQAVGTIADNYSDVIEGGNTWRGSGTAYRGIPGNYSNDPQLRDGTDTPLTVIGTSVSTTTFDVANTYTWTSDRWVKTSAPSYWALCDTAGSNYGQARKISGYNASTYVFTVGSAFDATPSTDDSMIILQGFKRLPDDVDIDHDDNETPGGFDRSFQIEILPGKPLEYSGRGVLTFETEMELRLRLAKYGRRHDWKAAALENLAILMAGIERGGRGSEQDHRDGTYTRALWAESSPQILKDDKYKVLGLLRWTLIYRIDAELL
jgi:hypothetical protein